MRREFRWGFKKECEEICHEVRSELGLERYAAFDPFALAKHLLIPYESIEDYASEDGCGWAVAHLTEEGCDEFSAAIVYRGMRGRILYNGQNSPARMRSDIAHELSHVLLEHEPGPRCEVRENPACGIPSKRRRRLGWAVSSWCRSMWPYASRGATPLLLEWQALTGSAST